MEVLFKLRIPQRYVHSLERYWKNSVLVLRILLICKFLNFAVILTKKTHTCEEGGTHLRISFWHLLMNFEKPEKSEFWKNEKKLLEISSFYTCVPKTTIIWGTVPEIWSETILSFWTVFCPFTPLPPLTAQKMKISKKWKKHLEISSFYTSVPKTWSYAILFLRYGAWRM